MDAARVAVELAGGERLVHPDPIGPILLDVPLAAVVRFEVGSLALALPRELAPLDQGSLLLTLAPVGGSEPIVRRLELPGPGGSALALDDRTLRCAHVPPGEYELVVTLREPARTHQPGAAAAEPLRTSPRRITVRAGAETRID
jgi:hypothetical protein